MYFAYILKSLVSGRTYTGHTDDIVKRLAEHNQGKSTFTSQYRPWKLIHLERLASEEEAVKRERYYKSAAGRRWMKKFLFSH